MAVVFHHRPRSPAIRGYNALMGAYLQAKKNAETQENIWAAEQSQRQADAIGGAIEQIGTAPFEGLQRKYLLDREERLATKKIAATQRGYWDRMVAQQDFQVEQAQQRFEDALSRIQFSKQLGGGDGGFRTVDYGGQQYNIPIKEYQGIMRNFGMLTPGIDKGDMTPADSVKALFGFTDQIAGQMYAQQAQQKAAQQAVPSQPFLGSAQRVLQDFGGSQMGPPQPQIGPDGTPVIPGMTHSPAQQAQLRQMDAARAVVDGDDRITADDRRNWYVNDARKRRGMAPTIKVEKPPTQQDKIQQGYTFPMPEHGVILSDDGKGGTRGIKIPSTHERTEGERKVEAEKQAEKSNAITKSVGDLTEKSIQAGRPAPTQEEKTKHAVDTVIATETAETLSEQIRQYKQGMNAVRQLKAQRGGPEWNEQREAQFERLLVEILERKKRLQAAGLATEIF
jgi:hypothetical protein